MRSQKVLALILAGGKGSRLEVLTKERAKPAMPFAGTHRLIDYALSNCMNSAISDVWVIEQHQLHSLNEHLSNGRPWDLDRTYGGLRVLPPYTAESSDEEEGGFASGNADAIYRHRRLIRDFQPDVLLVLSADHVYKLDYNEVISEHLRRDAEITIVTKEIPIDEAARFGTVIVADDNRITDFEYKPERPRSGTVTTEVFVYNAKILLDTLDELVARSNQEKGDDAEDAPLKDFGHELLPHLVSQGRAYAHLLAGYWQDLGTLESYWQAHMDLLSEDSELDLTDHAWTIRTFTTQQLPAHIHRTAKITNSLISPGCNVRGTIENSVISPGVIIEENAIVRNSIILSDCVIGRGATIDFAIIDSQVDVGASAQVGSMRADETKAKIKGSEITVVGQRAHVAAEATIEVGARIEPCEEVFRQTARSA